MKQQRIILSLLCACLSTVTAWAQNSDIISFADPEVKRICVKNWDTNGDGELSKQEAAAVTDIGTVFKNNREIKSFHEFQFFTNVTSIGDYAFFGCSLTSVTIPQSVTSIRMRAFESCCVTSVTIPSSVKRISDYAFVSCIDLTSLTILEGVTSIGNYAFYGCSGLISLTIPSSVTSIGMKTFSGCSGLTSIMVDERNTVYDSRNNCNAIIKTSDNTLIAGCKNTVIPSSVTSISEGAFDGSGLTSVAIPSSVTSISEGAFMRCSSLTSILVEEGNAVYDSRNNCNAIIKASNNTLIAGCKNTVIPSNVTSIGYYAFYGCSGLTSLTIPSSVTSIGKYAFCHCSDLPSLTIPNSVTSIEDDTFGYCYGLISITIPNSVTSIGKYAFYDCSGLTSLTIPNSVTSIGYCAFRGCTGLAAITIPNSVTSIGESAFYSCSGLTSVTVGWDAPLSINANVFRNINYNNVTLYVPKSTKTKYEVTDGWKDFKNIVEMDEENPDPQPTTGELRAEYFIDNDPGYGKATAITEPEWGEKGYELQLNGVKAGPHVLYVRAKDKEGRWSATANHPLFVIAYQGFEAMEYFYDQNDPGQGKATPIARPLSSTGEMVVSLSTKGLKVGRHQLTVRGRDSKGRWKVISSEPFNVTISQGIITVTSDFSFDIKAIQGLCTITPRENCLRGDCRVEICDLSGHVLANTLWRHNESIMQLPLNTHKTNVLIVKITNTQDGRSFLRRLIIK